MSNALGNVTVLIKGSKDLISDGNNSKCKRSLSRQAARFNSFTSMKCLWSIPWVLLDCMFLSNWFEFFELDGLKIARGKGRAVLPQISGA